MSDSVHVIGASGRAGAALCRALLARGCSFVPVVRDAAKWRALGLPGAARIANAGEAASLGACLKDARRVVSFAHASHSASVLAAAPADCRFVLIGSTRRFTRWPDAHGSGVIAGEAAFLASGRNGVMLHPTMIYGAGRDDTVGRLAAMLRRLPVVPLPGGGRALVQPIHEADVVRCVLAALERDWGGPRTLVVAGPSAMTYADFVLAVARAAGLRRPRIVPVPVAPLLALASLTRLLPFLPRISPDEVRRLTENKAFSIDEMEATLGVHPMPLEEGLRLTFATPPAPPAPSRQREESPSPH
jgi:nucleoside-diphosphate-sugar epimerase